MACLLSPSSVASCMLISCNDTLSIVTLFFSKHFAFISLLRAVDFIPVTRMRRERFREEAFSKAAGVSHIPPSRAIVWESCLPSSCLSPRLGAPSSVLLAAVLLSGCSEAFPFASPHKTSSSEERQVPDNGRCRRIRMGTSAGAGGAGLRDSPGCYQLARLM